jgi:acetoin utilization deacetylase AcuC-like enzyme
LPAKNNNNNNNNHQPPRRKTTKPNSETYVNYFGRSPYERIKLRQLDLSKLPIEGLTQLECGGQGADIDTAWNEEQTPGVARLAAGCVIEAAVRVATGRLLNAFAVVRPPGESAAHV